jgi:CYTH domain-containing protein
MNTDKHIETERKYIIRKPDIGFLSELECYTVSEITQIYLSLSKEKTDGIRRRVFADRTDYTRTVKTRIDKMSNIEDEREITEEEFTELSGSMREDTVPLKKTRHTFSYLGKTFEIDIYPYWERSCIMEVELDFSDRDVTPPPFIEIIREVTGDRTYSNALMSKSFPSEIV